MKKKLLKKEKWPFFFVFCFFVFWISRKRSGGWRLRSLSRFLTMSTCIRHGHIPPRAFQVAWWFLRLSYEKWSRRFFCTIQVFSRWPWSRTLLILRYLISHCLLFPCRCTLRRGQPPRWWPLLFKKKKTDKTIKVTLLLHGASVCQSVCTSIESKNC